MKHKGKCQNVYQYLAVSSSFTIFEGTFAALPLTFLCSTLQLSQETAEKK